MRVGMELNILPVNGVYHRVGEAVRPNALDENQLDAGMVYGSGFAPFRGGPLHYIKTMGADTLFRRLQDLEHRLGPRFIPDPGWELVSGFKSPMNSDG